jgi:hypothetical protein
MSSHTYIERNRLESLQTEYRRSWHSFTVAVEDLQTTLSDASASGETISEARTRVESAVLEYREARNTLAECLLEDVAEQNVEEGEGSCSGISLAGYRAA